MTYAIGEDNREDVEKLIETIEAEGWSVTDYRVSGDARLKVDLDLVK